MDVSHVVVRAWGESSADMLKGVIIASIALLMGAQGIAFSSADS